MPVPHSSLRRKFILWLGSLLLFFLIALFSWMYFQARSALFVQLDQQARVLLQQLIITRRWVADHGGLYAPRGAGEEGNPFLPGTEIVDRAGTTYLFRNPALVTRELSGYAAEAGLYSFRLTSLRPRNPANAPTPSEQEILAGFEAAGYEASREGIGAEVREDGRPLYRRMVPLRVEPSCLECHADQGYAVGDVRGGLSVLLPMAATLESLSRTRHSLGLAGLGIIGLVCGVLYLLLRKLVLTPIGHLHEVAGRLSHGEYGMRAALSTGDEFEALAVAFNHMTGRIKHGYEGALKSLVAAMDARDPYTRGHTARVAEYATGIARQLGLADEQVDQVELGAVLHDIGKIGISDAILKKCSGLEEEETEVMRSHVLSGAKIIRNADFLLCALPAIIHHHERLDGTGYPEGLQGDELPLMARIIAVADTFDAITTDRPYRKGLSREEALQEIERHSGTQFAPEVVTAFRAVIGSAAGRAVSAEGDAEERTAAERH